MDRRRNVSSSGATVIGRLIAAAKIRDVLKRPSAPRSGVEID